MLEYKLIGMEAATSAGTARAEAPGLSKAREKAVAVPAKSVRRNGNQRLRTKRVSRNEFSGHSYLLLYARINDTIAFYSYHSDPKNKDWR